MKYSKLLETKHAARKDKEPASHPMVLNQDSQTLPPQDSEANCEPMLPQDSQANCPPKLPQVAGSPSPTLPQGTQVESAHTITQVSHVEERSPSPVIPQGMEIDSPVIGHEVLCVDTPRQSPRKRQATHAPAMQPSTQRLAHDTLIKTWESDVTKFKMEIKSLKNEISKLKKERGVNRRKVTMLEKKINALELKIAAEHERFKRLSVEELVPKVLNEFLDKYQKRTGGARIGKAIVNAISDPEFRGGCCLPAIRTHANTYLRKNYFTPQACAKAADLSGGKLNGTTWTSIREIYTRGQKSVRDCPIPSSSTVYAAKKIVEERAKKLIPFEVFEQASGEGIRFEPKKTN